MTRIVPAGLALVLSLAATAPAQEAPPPGSRGVRQVVEVRAVDLDVVATKDGRPVDDLTKEEISIRVNGRPVPLDYFARVTAGTIHGPDLATASPDLVLETLKADTGARYLPRQFLLFFDDAHLLPFERDRVIEGLRDFVTRLTPSDRVSVVSYGTTTRVLVPFTSSKEDLLDGLDRLSKIAPAGLRWDTQFRQQVQQVLSARRSTTRDALVREWSAQAYRRELGLLEELRRSVAALGARAGKRVLLYVSDGLELRPGETLAMALGPSLSQFDRNVGREFADVLAEANRVGVTIHALDAKGLTVDDVDASSRTASPFSSFLASQTLREPLQALADATGGLLVTNRNAFGAGLDRIYRDSTTYYSVGVTLRSLDPREKEHRVEVTTARPGVTLRARRAVGAGTADEAARDRVEMALMNPDAAGEFPATLSIGAVEKGGGLGRRLVPYEILVPLSALTFREEGGNRVAPLEIGFAAVSDTGERSPVSTTRVTATLGPGDAQAQTWRYRGTLKTGKGNVRFVATVRDLATDRIAIASAPVRVE